MSCPFHGEVDDRRAADRRSVGVGVRRRSPAMNCWCSSWVESTASTRMLSVLPKPTAARCAGLREQPAHLRGSNTPAAAAAPAGEVHLVHPVRGVPRRRSWRRRARGRAAWGGAGSPSGTRSAKARFSRCFSSSPSSLCRAGSALANSTTSRVEEREAALDRVGHQHAVALRGEDVAGQQGRHLQPLGAGQRVPAGAAGGQRAADRRRRRRLPQSAAQSGGEHAP